MLPVMSQLQHRARLIWLRANEYSRKCFRISMHMHILDLYILEYSSIYMYASTRLYTCTLELMCTLCGSDACKMTLQIY